MNNEKLYDRTENNLKSEIHEKVKKLYKPILYYMGGVDLGKIQEEFFGINKDVIRNLLNELVYCDKKLTVLDRGTITDYIPKEKLVRIKEEDKKKKKTKDELRSEIYEKVKELYKSSSIYKKNGVSLRSIETEFPDIAEDIIHNLLDELVFCDDKLIRIEDSWVSYLPKELVKIIKR